MNGLLLETGEAFGRRDYSREQHVIRKIAANNLQRILYYGEAGTLIGFGSASPGRIQHRRPEDHNSDFNDIDQNTDLDPVYSAKLARVRRYLVRRQTLLKDRGRCILSHYHATDRKSVV